MWHERIHSRRANPWLIAAMLGAAIALPAVLAQQPQLGQGFPRPAQPPPNPAESTAYSAAISQADPGARASAIQQFLIQYPNSPLRQTAVSQLMLAKRQAGSAGPTPPSGASLGRPMTQPMSQPAAQPMTQPANAPASAPNAPVIAAQPPAPPRDSLLQHPAKPAQVAVLPGSLSINADNSSLSDILEQISRSTGMKVEGLAKDDRIFGTYGPGDPREVLLSLLQGSGYNVLMVGDNKGAPRQLSLSQRVAGSAVASAATVNNHHQEEDDDIEQEPPPQPEQPQNQPPPANPEVTQPRNPAEIQQELLRLRQQQQQLPQQQPQ